MAPPVPPDQETALSLALAVIAASSAPLVLLDGQLTVLAASSSFYSTFHLDPVASAGRQIFTLGDGEWDVRQLRSLLKATALGHAEIDAYEMDLKSERRETRRLVLSAQLLSYNDRRNVRLLLSVADVTDARLAAKLKDDLLREKAILLQEVQHRVANSLQIIASVILQSARMAQSEEARVHLTDAHNRVMSIGALQKQLAVSSTGMVALRPYFIQLCESIGASMIQDHDQLTLRVEADDSSTRADVSVSLGLIVTELVINCLKHAFPQGRGGEVLVGYASHGPNWTLSVADNGVGMPGDEATSIPGLGSSIVEALANQLSARVQVAQAHPGTMVSVIHTQLAAVGETLDRPRAAF
jgi:two-component sensor histidine kinase